MAKKIILSFNAKPIAGDYFKVEIFVEGVPVVYDSGILANNITFLATGNPNTITPLGVEIQPNSNGNFLFTIENLLSFLITNFSSNTISYEMRDDAIDILVTGVTGAITATVSVSSSRITSTQEDLDEEIIDPVLIDLSYTLRYFFRYTNFVNDTYICRIYKRNNALAPIEINGTATIEKGSVKDHLDTIRGTGLSLELEASTVLTLEDLYTQDEQDFTVKLYKNGNVIFSGFLKPDGIFQSFVRDKWVLSLDCIDGLGALSNLSFVQLSGLPFVGKMKAIDIVYYCLKRTGIALPINTSINTLHEGLTASDNLDILTKIKLNAERFKKTDNDTLMSCEEVLKSVLDIFCACITQLNGEWYIFKANEIYSTPNVLFRRYDLDNVYVGNITLNTNQVLGSQIDLFYPHHCNGDQKIEIKGGISAFRLGYKYGFVKGLLPNVSLQHSPSMVYDNWTVLDGTNLINDPTKTSGFVIKNIASTSTTVMVKSDDLAVVEGDFLSIKVNYSLINGSVLVLSIKNGTFYLKSPPIGDLLAPLNEDERLSASTWVTDSTAIYTLVLANGGGQLQANFPKIPFTGGLNISILQTGPFAGISTINSLDLIPNVGAKSEQGEFHTVSRANKVSTIVKENKTVYNGDNAGIVYSGAIYKEDGIATTGLWFRKGKFESKPILRIAAEEELRISQKPLKVFKGSVLGYIPYLSFIDINNITGKFMPIEYSYDTKANITKLKLLELYSAEITDLRYKFTLDYGNTVKPTITG